MIRWQTKLLIVLFIVGCDRIEPESEIKDVAWIYYGNHIEKLTGCYWTGESFPNQTIGFSGGFIFVDSNEKVHNIQCESFGQKEYIRHYIDFNYFSIYLESHIYPEYYDTLMYEYLSN